jgi:hypothetical protein
VVIDMIERSCFVLFLPFLNHRMKDTPLSLLQINFVD